MFWDHKKLRCRSFSHVTGVFVCKQVVISFGVLFVLKCSLCQIFLFVVDIYWLPVSYGLQFKSLHSCTRSTIFSAHSILSTRSVSRQMQQDNAYVPQRQGRQFQFVLAQTLEDEHFQAVWNSLPSSLDSLTVKQFRRQLKTYYVTVAFS